MPRLRPLAIALLPFAAGPALAQAPQVFTHSPPPLFAPPSDADQLATQMRALAADPANLSLLVTAARLSLKLGDADAAAALYTRAERVNPNDPQVKAGMARLLVQSERPAEALRLFQQAAALGASASDFGPDRALAYDLIGQQERAQRDYRALLLLARDDETIRRYALSLAISGRREPALALLEPLNRQGDRGAWRARAFVLAMTGDRAGAGQIATTMMPAGMAQGLSPFFDRLPRLSPVDRAFAVHFGETRPSAVRLADARRVPPLPALAPEPDPFPVARAAVQVADTGKKAKRDRKRNAAAPVVAYVAPLPAPPAPTASQLAGLAGGRVPFDGYGARAGTRFASGGVTVLPPPRDAYMARADPVAATAGPALASDDGGDDGPDESAVATRRQPVQLALATPRPPTPGFATPPAAPATPPAALATALPVVVPATTPPAAPPPVAATPPAPASPGQSALASFSAATDPQAGAVAEPVVPPVYVTTPAAPPTPVATAAITPATGTPPRPRDAEGDAVLAAIVAGITVPETELAAAAPPRPRLLTNVERKADVAASSEAKLPPRDRRGRYLDATGTPLLDPQGRPLGPKGAAAWLAAQADLPRATKADAAVPRKDARGRYVDAKGKPLLDPRGRPLDAKGAAAWQAAQAEPGRPAKGDVALRKDARGRFVDDRGKPLLDARGRPLDAKAAASRLVEGKGTATRKPDVAKAEPARFWVQVAGGANEDTLGKEWKRVSGQAAALKGKAGWTTPLRATNRILTGPFKSSAEAMTAVNQLKKQGVAAFMFASEPGQKVTRLAGQ